MPTKKTEEKAPKEIAILDLQIEHVQIPIAGDSLIVHNWSNKALEEMRTRKEHRAKQKKAPCDPKAEFLAAKYLTADGKDGFPVDAIKNAIVSAARHTEDIKMTALRGAVYLRAGGRSTVGAKDLVTIQYDKCVMREDPVRVGGFGGGADLRYRPEYINWRAVLDIEYNVRDVTLEQLVHLVKLAGFSVGICEWRPEKRGQHGRFRVELEKLKQKPTMSVAKRRAA